MKTFCTLRNIYRSIREFELKFQEQHGLCLNEGMLLCSLQSSQYSSSEIAELLGLTNSNTSKVIKSVEEKGYVERILGKEDKRQMYFSITNSGSKKLSEIKCDAGEVATLLNIIKADTIAVLEPSL